jgi:glyoxylase-like metal-dependent hydrolase (beta-lactamase superfamily II)
MKRVGILAAIVVTGVAVTGVAAQRGGGGRGGGVPNPIQPIEKVKENLYVIHGGTAGNTTVFLTQAGVVLVDTKVANSGEAIMNQVKTVTDKPVSMIINTHSHPDHMGSNNYFAPTVEKVTHENTKKWMGNNPQYASNPAVMPTKTFTDKMTIGKGKDQIDLYYFGAGHTDGDAFIVFKEAKTVAVGDLMAWNMAPLIDPNAGGSIIALGETFKKAEKGIKNVDTVIEGHGNVNTFKGMAAYGEFMRALVDTAREGLKKQQTTQQALDELKKNQKFAVFLGTEVLKGTEYGDTPEHRALINLNVAYQELRGEPVTTHFGPVQSIGPEKGSAPPPAPRGGGAGRGAGGPGRGGPGGPPPATPAAPPATPPAAPPAK